MAAGKGTDTPLFRFPPAFSENSGEDFIDIAELPP